MDAKTISEAFGLEGPLETEEIDEPEADDADETAIDDDIDAAFSGSARPADRREAFIRAVKAAMKG